MADAPAEHRFYGDLAVWWPLISPPEEYAEEAAEAAALLTSVVAVTVVPKERTPLSNDTTRLFAGSRSNRNASSDSWAMPGRQHGPVEGVEVQVADQCRPLGRGFPEVVKGLRNSFRIITNEKEK